MFLSFQATSTDFLLVSTRDGKSALCVGKRAFFVMVPNGGTGAGAACPEGVDAKPAAVVNTDSAWLAKLGWMILGAGFLLQIFSIKKPRETDAPRSSYGPRQKSLGK